MYCRLLTDGFIEDKSLNENKELKLTVSEENAEGSSPGPDKILFVIPPDVIYGEIPVQFFG